MRKTAFYVVALALLAASLASPASANVPGAIFTTTSDGSEVNFNIYAAKTDVYLNGGPGPGAPATAAGLPNGTYVFMVTDPPGKTLLSTDIAACRRFVVTGGFMTSLVTTGCPAPHVTGVDAAANEPGGITVQLMPFDDTPNNGGEYKAWATPVEDYLCPLSVRTCNLGEFGFQSDFSKRDNFKVRVTAIREIDTRFHDTNNNNALIDGLGITWFDTLGNANNKWSYLNLALDINHEAHVEAPENGTHQIVISNQTGCTVDGNKVFFMGTQLTDLGPQTVIVKVSASDKNITYVIDVYCN